ncbi:MAG: hypothetical protein Q4P34_06840 [Tissierellia bacterium]|nr:hypothetical protein [Tissierellia bacterium]
MYNFIRTDIYRMFRTKSFYMVILIIFSLTIGLSIGLYHIEKHIENLEAKESKDNSIRFEIDFKNIDGAETEKDIDKVMKESMKFDKVLIFSFNQGYIMLFSIFFALFISSDFQNCTIKNILGIYGSRSKWVTSYFILSIIIFIIMSLISIISSLVLCLYFNGEIIYDLEISSIVKVFLMSSINYIGLFILIIFITTVFQNKISVILATIILALNLPNTVLSIIGNAFKIDLGRYWINTNLSNALDSIINNTNLKLENILIPIIYIIVFYIGSILIMKNKDIQC